VVVPSSWYEGFPNVILEAMRSKKPVICSNIGGLPEIVDNGETGLLFEAGNSEDLADKILYLWDRPQLCKQMGEAGYSKLLREYTPSRYYERLWQVYQRALQDA
jgi:glycosyltransferase involved in cell wall biosynthesis